MCKSLGEKRHVRGERRIAVVGVDYLFITSGDLKLRDELNLPVPTNSAHKYDLTKDDVGRLPTLFRVETPGTGGIPTRHIAYTAGVVNMLVITNASGGAVLVVPKPYGPVVGGRCQYEENVTNQLTPLGYAEGTTLRYVKDFFTYHDRAGEIHCGTNSRRKPPAGVQWWEQMGVW